MGKQRKKIYSLDVKGGNLDRPTFERKKEMVCLEPEEELGVLDEDIDLEEIEELDIPAFLRKRCE